VRDVSGGIWGRLAGYLESWLLPSAAGVTFVALVLLPAANHEPVATTLSEVDTVGQAALFVLAMLLVSFLLDSVSLPLARLLEGYTLPKPLADRLKQRQRRRWEALRAEIAAADKETALRLRGKLNSYPRSEEYLLPTRLGNALRAGETYGWEQYRISTVDLWTRLVAVAEQRTVDQIQQARVRLDLFLALIWLSLVLSPVTIGVSIWSAQPALLWWLVPLVGLLPVWYGRAVAAVSWYSQGMQAMVDLSRGKLAASLGIRLPGTIAAERRIWEAVSEYASWGRRWSTSPQWIKTIDEALMPTGAAADDPDQG
jgi:hypothetical protein